MIKTKTRQRDYGLERLATGAKDNFISNPRDQNKPAWPQNQRDLTSICKESSHNWTHTNIYFLICLHIRVVHFKSFHHLYFYAPCGLHQKIFLFETHFIDFLKNVSFTNTDKYITNEKELIQYIYYNYASSIDMSITGNYYYYYF